MNAQIKVEPASVENLRKPFPDNQVSKLPKETRAQIDQRKADRNSMVFNCAVCGGHHHKNAVHLDYVGHAALTDRLLDTDIEWSWEPLAFDDHGLPAFDRNNGLWIKLTVCGITRLGYGSADGKSGGDAIKEIIGDALRNAAMRFGAALDLWHKGDLHADEAADEGHSQTGAVSPPAADCDFPDGPAKNITALKRMQADLWREIEGCGDSDELEPFLALEETRAVMKQLANLEHPSHRQLWFGDGEDNPGLQGLIRCKRALFEMAANEPNILAAG